MKVNINLEGMKQLAIEAKKGGTEHIWVEIAIDWMEQANIEIERLNQLTKHEAESNQTPYEEDIKREIKR